MSRKTPKLKSKRIDLSVKRYWNAIVNDVNDVNDVAIDICVDFLHTFTIDLKDNTYIEFDVVALLNTGFNAEEISNVINKQITLCKDEIANVRYKVDVEVLAAVVTPATQDLLKKLD